MCALALAHPVRLAAAAATTAYAAFNLLWQEEQHESTHGVRNHLCCVVLHRAGPPCCEFVPVGGLTGGGGG